MPKPARVSARQSSVLATVLVLVLFFGTPSALLISHLVRSNASSQKVNPNAAPTAVPPTSAPAPGALRYAVYGDSITIADSPDTGNPLLGSWSWTRFVDPRQATFVSGYAKGKVSTADLAKVARPMDADVLVIMAGTNDLFQHIPFSQTRANIMSIVNKTGIHHVVISFVPPFDPEPSPIPDAPDQAKELNQHLQNLAQTQNWEFVDPMSSIRNSTLWKNRNQMTPDGIHPYTAAAQIIGQSMGKALAASRFKNGE